jgi:CDP-diacylglycerol--glycerol-3-phosphate 3-phosphatidyltransferase
MIPIYIVIMLADFPYHSIVALAIFALASITDSVDGYIARKYNQVTNFGKFIDPLADKLLVMAAILIFVERGQMASWAATIIIAREFAVTGLRLIAMESRRVIAAAMSGKIKTASSIIAICLMLTPWHGFNVLAPWLTLDVICVAVMVITTVWSGTEYFIINRDVLRFKD